ncbi:glycosyl transferase 2 family protein [Lyngbya aestuarii BL J]|uniref:Glycosyl transferase 2 family protein n=1 Tax=Lyngbya aestuarii BL J TaxID=1348334 RepID=U7QS94_9CYAN|nr:glycosyltransferase family A protein [Lyngbya aestuarii]ERT09960.1 glycosyl transferase 2 family protein [Lyngbya aestuarii BL J]
MSNHFPLVSVVIPSYNAQAFISRTLESVLCQTYTNLEVIVVDDGSQDQTAEIVQRFAQQDKRVTLLQQLNLGVAAARNLGIEQSKGEFIAPIDADDIWYPQNIEKQVQCFLTSKPSVGLVYSWTVDIDENDVLTGGFRAARIEEDVYVTLLCHDFVANASCVLIRRSCLEKTGSYNTKLREQNGQGGEDWDLYLRMAEHYQFRVVPEFLVAYRKHSHSMSCDCVSMAKSRELIWESISQKYPQMPAIIQQLSNSSFYMYLASASSRTGQHQSTLFWVYKALKTDCITPFLRLGLYILPLKSILMILTQPILSKIANKNQFLIKLKPSYPKSNRPVKTIEEMTQQQVNTNIKVIAEKILHHILPLLLGTPQTWQTLNFNRHEQISNIS